MQKALFYTADLCDRYAGQEGFQIAESILRHFGGKRTFCGQITTLKVFEDNSLVRSALEEKVDGRVLVIDGGGSRRCALLGDTLTTLAFENGWQGIVVYGCVRGSSIIENLPIGLMALNTHPLRSNKHNRGDRDILLSFAGINFKKDHFLYADSDGIIVSETNLL